MNRKRMMKLFCDYMSLYYLLRGKLKSAFAAGEASYTVSSESDLNLQGDAFCGELRALSN
jgi:hypothetical protein